MNFLSLRKGLSSHTSFKQSQFILRGSLKMPTSFKKRKERLKSLSTLDRRQPFEIYASFLFDSHRIIFTNLHRFETLMKFTLNCASLHPWIDVDRNFADLYVRPFIYEKFNFLRQKKVQVIISQGEGSKYMYKHRVIRSWLEVKLFPCNQQFCFI